MCCSEREDRHTKRHVLSRSVYICKHQLCQTSFWSHPFCYSSSTLLMQESKRFGIPDHGVR